MNGILYVVGTPIGNLGDMSPRAIDTLENVDFIAAEDTRVTLKLLNKFNIKKPMISYFEHNKKEHGNIICQRILQGENCAIVTDAGMPCISDPGETLIKQCAENNIITIVIPGASAVVSALAISGLDTKRFTFEGFLSVEKRERREHLNELIKEKRTMVFYEAPHKLASTLKDFYDTFGERKISIVREITKVHEEVIRTTLSKAVENYSNGELKGEIVLVLEGYTQVENEEAYTIDDAYSIALQCIKNGMSSSESAKKAAQTTGFKKSDIYKMIVNQ